VQAKAKPASANFEYWCKSSKRNALRVKLNTLSAEAVNGIVLMIRATFKNLVLVYISGKDVSDWV